MDPWVFAGGTVAVLAALVVWLSFVEKPVGGFSTVGRLIAAGSAGAAAYWFIGLGLPNRDVRGVAWSLFAGVVVWRAGALLRDFRPIQWALAIATTMGVFLLWWEGWPGDFFGWVRLSAAALFGVYLTVVRRVPGRYRGSKRPDPSVEERSPIEFTSDDGARLIDAIDLLFGSTRPGTGVGVQWEQRRVQRSNNAHGSFARGTLHVSPAFRRRGPPPLFRRDQIEVLARFSNVKGHGRTEKLPAAGRDDSARDVHGLALRFSGNGVSSLDLITLDIDRFIVRSRSDFIVIMRLIAAGRLKMYPGVLRMLAFGRTTVRAVWTARGKAVSSYVEHSYYGIHTFWWRIGATTVPVRYVLTPQSVGFLRPPGGNRCARLDDDLSYNLGAKRTAHFRFDLVDGSSLNRRQWHDPVSPWPKGTPVAHVGELVLERYVEDDGSYDALGFNPHHLTRGITASDDEILMARRAAYPESHLRRLANRESARSTRPGPSL